MATATISLTVRAAGETVTSSQTRTEDGVVAVTPTCPHAFAGVLTTRTSATEGVITATGIDLTDSDKAVLTWEAANGDLKHRYDVDIAVATTDSGSASGTSDDEFEVTFSGGAGDDLPVADYTVNIALQVLANITFDFDDVDEFTVYMNVRGVVAFLDGTDTEKWVGDLAAGRIAFWARDMGFEEPFTGTPVTYVLCGSGSTATATSFLPKVLVLYDATDPAGSGQ